MRSLISKVRAFLKEEDGLTTVEYAVAGGLIAAALVTAFIALGDTVRSIIEYITGQLQTSPGA